MQNDLQNLYRLVVVQKQKLHMILVEVSTSAYIVDFKGLSPIHLQTRMGYLTPVRGFA